MLKSYKIMPVCGMVCLVCLLAGTGCSSPKGSNDEDAGVDPCSDSVDAPGWTRTPVLSELPSDLEFDATIGRDGSAHCCFQYTRGDIYVLDYATNISGDWVVERVGEPMVSSVECRIVVTDEDVPYIAADMPDARRTVLSRASGTWQPTGDNIGGNDAHYAADGNGLRASWYNFDQTIADKLKVASWDGDTWEVWQIAAIEDLNLDGLSIGGDGSLQLLWHSDGEVMQWGQEPDWAFEPIRAARSTSLLGSNGIPEVVIQETSGQLSLYSRVGQVWEKTDTGLSGVVGKGAQRDGRDRLVFVYLDGDDVRLSEGAPNDLTDTHLGVSGKVPILRIDPLDGRHVFFRSTCLIHAYRP